MIRGEGEGEGGERKGNQNPFIVSTQTLGY